MSPPDFDKAFNTVIASIESFEKTLSPREVVVLQIGMRASHIEEALAHGENDRARSHLAHLVDLIQTLEG